MKETLRRETAGLGVMTEHLRHETAGLGVMTEHLRRETAGLGVMTETLRRETADLGVMTETCGVMTKGFRLMTVGRCLMTELGESVATSCLAEPSRGADRAHQPGSNFCTPGGTASVPCQHHLWRCRQRLDVAF